MNPDRLIEIIEAYGAEPRRWPASERAAAETLMAERPELAERLRFDARQTDAALDASLRPAVSMALQARVTAAAPTAAIGAGRRGVGFHIGRLIWWGGAGWAAAACAGVVVGLGVTTHVTADAQADAVLYQASLMGVDDMEVLQ